MTDEELAELRAYKPAEVAAMLNLPITRLHQWVRDDLVPHARAGVVRGVEFSAEDELAGLRFDRENWSGVTPTSARIRSFRALRRRTAHGVAQWDCRESLSSVGGPPQPTTSRADLHSRVSVSRPR
jgi:hypothetical protein